MSILLFSIAFLAFDFILGCAIGRLLKGAA